MQCLNVVRRSNSHIEHKRRRLAAADEAAGNTRDEFGMTGHGHEDVLCGSEPVRSGFKTLSPRARQVDLGPDMGRGVASLAAG